MESRWWKRSSMAFIMTLFILIPGLLGLKDVKIIVPKYVGPGDTVRLTCQYDMEKEILYAVKWYKGAKGLPFNEFYRFIPIEKPPGLAFSLPALDVDVELSNNHDVFLRNASKELSGLYKCSVVAEFPFETLEDTGEMKVVVIGEGVPVLRLDKMDRLQYHPGEKLTISCESPASFPPPNITWYLNDKKVDDEKISKTEMRKEAKNPNMQSVVSTLSFDLPEKVELARIYCRANVLSLYDRSSNITILKLVPRRLSATLLRSSSSRAFRDVFIIFIILFGIKMICTMQLPMLDSTLF